MASAQRSSSRWQMIMVYGGIGAAYINPLLGIAVATVGYHVHKHYDAQARVEAEVKRAADKEKFRHNFYRRQHYDSYRGYLLSPAWRTKRNAVMARCGGICEDPECTRAALEVHHTWYPRVWGTEPITALMGLCAEHHEAAHGRRR